MLEEILKLAGSVLLSSSLYFIHSCDRPLCVPLKSEICEEEKQLYFENGEFKMLRSMNLNEDINDLVWTGDVLYEIANEDSKGPGKLHLFGMDEDALFHINTLTGETSKVYGYEELRDMQATGIAFDGKVFYEGGNYYDLNYIYKYFLNEEGMSHLETYEFALEEEGRSFVYPNIRGLVWAVGYLWSLTDYGEIIRINFEKKEVSSNCNLPGEGYNPDFRGIAWDGRYFWISEGEDKLHLYDPCLNKVVKSHISPVEEPGALVFEDEGEILWLVGPGTIYTEGVLYKFKLLGENQND